MTTFNRDRYMAGYGCNAELESAWLVLHHGHWRLVLHPLVSTMRPLPPFPAANQERGGMTWGCQLVTRYPPEAGQDPFYGDWGRESAQGPVHAPGTYDIRGMQGITDFHTALPPGSWLSHFLFALSVCWWSISTELESTYLQPFTNYFPHVDIHEFIAPDLLHQVIKGTFKDHLVTWVEEYIVLTHGKTHAKQIWDDIDKWYENFACNNDFIWFHPSIGAAPPFSGLRQFKEGHGFKQWMGDDSKALMKVH